MPYAHFGPWGVSYAEVLRFVEDNPCVANWLKKYSVDPRSKKKISGTRLHKSRRLCRFFKWLKAEKKIDLSPGELLNYQNDLRQNGDITEKRWLLNLVLEHTRDNTRFENLDDETKYDIFTTIKAFCTDYEVPLTLARNVYGGKRRRRKNFRKQLTSFEAKRLLGEMNQRDRAIHLIQIQSGMSIGDVLDKFNYMWFSQVKPQLDVGYERLRIEFDERKANGTWYYTFISRDGIQELRKWLKEREKIVEEALTSGSEVSKEIIEGDPIFITFRATPLKRAHYTSQFNKKTGGKVTTHMFRKLFKSEASVPDRGINRNYVEFWMGHIGGANLSSRLDATGGVYDRTPEIYEKTHEKEYAKLEPYVNIYSGVQQYPVTPLDEEWMQFSSTLREVLQESPDKREKLLKLLE